MFLKWELKPKRPHEASKIVVKFLKEGKVSKEEEHELKTQIYDLFKIAGIGIPFMLIPGSALLMPFLIKLANNYDNCINILHIQHFLNEKRQCHLLIFTGALI